MLIVQITDVHLRSSGLLHGRVDTTANLEAVLERVAGSGLRPDLLLLSGDLADDGAPGSYRALRQRIEPVAASLGSTVLYLPGNHDERAAFREVLLEGGPHAVRPRGGRDQPLDQAVELGGVRVVALDSVVQGHDHGELTESQLAWLAEQLGERAPAGTVLALHHPPVASPIELMTRISLRHPERLAAVVQASDVRLVVAGHYHHAMAASLGNVPVWVGPASAYQADVLVGPGVFRGLSGAAFSRIDLFDDGSVLATAVPLGGAMTALQAVSSAELGLA